MRVFKIILVFGILFIASLFIGFNYLQNTGPFSFLGSKYMGGALHGTYFYDINHFFDLTRYGFNKPPSEDALIIDFSDNDSKYNDSLMRIITKRESDIPDNLKEWKKTHLIYKKRRYKIKYKFHGSDNTPYKQGKISLKIKSKKYINDSKQFNLITSYVETSFINVFIALQEHKSKLIAPDPGRIMLANVNGRIEDFWFTEDMSDNYLKDTYGFEDYNIFEVSDNWNRNGGPHFSELDGFYYYVDKENIESDSTNYNKYKHFIKSIDSNDGDEFLNIDYQYVGRFLANLYFYNSEHHIRGDNNKLLYDYSNNIVYPVARNEGFYNKIADVLRLDQGVFDTSRKASIPNDISFTQNFYKKAVCNDSIKFYRDTELYKLVENKEKTLQELDSLYAQYNDYHKYYNVAYLKVKYNYKRLKEVIEHNSNVLLKYLDNGEVIIAYDKKNNTINIATDYRVPLKVIDIKNSEYFILNGFDLKFEEDVIKSALVEQKFTFKNEIHKDQLRIVNMITKDTIPSGNIIFNYF